MPDKRKLFNSCGIKDESRQEGETEGTEEGEMRLDLCSLTAFFCVWLLIKKEKSNVGTSGKSDSGCYFQDKHAFAPYMENCAFHQILNPTPGSLL